MSGGLRSLVRQPGWRRWTLASFLARLPVTMTLIALVLVGEEATGSVAVGAQLAGLATVVSGLAAPYRGRRLDRGELRSGLQRACVQAGAVFAAEAAALALGAPLAVLFALAALQGVAMAALSGGFRALLVPVVPATELSRANALEAVFVEVAFVTGPALAGIVAFASGTVAVLLVQAVAITAAAVVARRLPPLLPTVTQVAVSPWRTPGTRPIFALALALGVCIGAVEAALPARLVELGHAAAAAGPLMALIAGGSAIGGLVAATREDPTRHARVQAVVLLGLLALLLAPLAGVGRLGWLVPLLFVAGMPIAPLNALAAILLQERLPTGRQAEGFAVFIASILLGAGMGSGGAGVLLQWTGSQALLLAGAVIPLGAAALVAAWPVRRDVAVTSDARPHAG